MRIVIVTQDDPFFLAENIRYLLEKKDSRDEIVSCVVLGMSAFGKEKGKLTQLKETYDIFGFNFVFHYSALYLKNKLDSRKDLQKTLKQFGVPITRLEYGINHAQSLETLRALNPDLLISIGSNQIFKEKLINLAPKGCLNLHTALLPKYRGLMPTFWVLRNNEKETGVSIFFVDKGIDSGPILVQKKVDIGSDETQYDLIRRTKQIGMDAILESIEKIRRDDYSVLENNEAEMTYFSQPTREDVKAFYRNGKKFF